MIPKHSATTIQDFPHDECGKRLAELAKGLAHPARVEIIRMLKNKSLHERCVCGDIVNALPLAQSSVSQHLKTLKETGWIRGEIDGPCVCYCLVDGIMDFFRDLLSRAVQKTERRLEPNQALDHTYREETAA